MPTPDSPAETVVSLHGAPVESDRRREFLEAVAAEFDRFLSEHGEDPDGICFIMGGIRQAMSVNHLVQGETRGAGGAFKARAIMYLMNSASWI